MCPFNNRNNFVGSGPSVGLKGSRTLTERIFCNGGATLNFRHNGIIPGLVGSNVCCIVVFRQEFLQFVFLIAALGVQLDKHTVGYLTYTAGVQSSMSTVLEYNTEKQHFVLTCTIGIPHCFVSASYMRRLKEQELKVKISGKYVAGCWKKPQSADHHFSFQVWNVWIHYRIWSGKENFKIQFRARVCICWCSNWRNSQN